MVSRKVIDPKRIRRITGSFSWLDHRLISGGYLKTMTSDEMLLYFFFVLVGDRNGISFYHYQKICHLLGMDDRHFAAAQQGLITKAFIAYQNGRVQVLQLPDTQKQSGHLQPSITRNTAKSFREIVTQIAREGNAK